MELSLERIGLNKETVYIAKDLWSGEETQVKNIVCIALQEAQPKIYLLEEVK